MNSFSFIITSTSTCGEKSVKRFKNKRKTKIYIKIKGMTEKILIAFNKFNVWLGIATKLKNKFTKRSKKLINCKVYFLSILLLIPKKKLKIKK
ncbi:hypothetical protein [Spiroplasma endosymbiont of Apeira syringaria]|uniref:hypothetical protein n=1 Tax=Spiroplasma endosymbiont of Apeira syringaria TaxID=3066307 RepID=UPI0030D4992E